MFPLMFPGQEHSSKYTELQAEMRLTYETNRKARKSLQQFYIPLLMAFPFKTKPLSISLIYGCNNVLDKIYSLADLDVQPKSSGHREALLIRKARHQLKMYLFIQQIQLVDGRDEHAEEFWLDDVSRRKLTVVYQPQVLNAIRKGKR